MGDLYSRSWGAGVSGWKVTKRKQQGLGRFLLGQFSRIAEGRTDRVIRYLGWVRYQGLGIFLQLIHRILAQTGFYEDREGSQRGKSKACLESS